MADSALMGQENDDAKEVVRQQRTLKRKKDGLRKLDKRMRSVKTDSPEYSALVEESKALAAEVAAMEATLGVSTVVVRDASTAPPDAPTISGGAPAEKTSATGLAQSAASARSPSGAVSHGESQVRRGANPRKPERSERKDALAKASTEGERTATRAKKLQSQPNTSSPADKRTSDAVDVVQPGESVIESTLSGTQCPLFPEMPFQPPCSSELVHYQVAELALMMESMVIVGGNARTLAMIQAFKSLLQTTPVLSGPSLRDVNSKVFEELIDENFNFLRRGREPSTGMTYVKEVLVRRVAALLSSGGDFRVSEDGSFIPLEKEKKQGALEVTESPLTLSSEVENSLLAGDPREVSLKVLAGIEKELRLSIKSIVEDRSIPLISSNDTIMVFGRSSTVELILLGAANNPRLGVKPRVIVVDAAPLYEGRALAKRLTTSGLSVTYGLITSCCTLMPHCTRVFIGAAAVLQNGDVFSRCGTAVVVASAKQYRKPVLCFSESFKFISEVWLGNLGQNTQLQFSQSLPGDHRIRSPGGMSPPRHQNREINEQPFGRSNDGLPMQSSASSASGYLYDLTPAAFIDMIICEMGCLDTSAIVAALRDREDRDACLMSVA
ncbi:hypothetical protein ECC02_007525 [Trypanosoma cruzi]|uniref:Translation initiation factor eIF2B subunit delta n=1 Tax=Trypanosoma cruzi TaxID=5693 RepID=A0A7J6XZQ7_TRYCR|nr:hypothetical protein ECC02_007525 [Trypanosoma cruzi]